MLIQEAFMSSLKQAGWGMMLGLLLLSVFPLSAQQVFPYPYENFKLENGFKAILIPVEGSGLVAYYTVVRTGSRDEWEPGKSGFAHFFEHMMFRGTKNISADEYEKTITEMGANNNAYTTDDYTCYTLTVPSDNLETAMRLESDRFQNLSYEEEPFRTEAGAVYGEYRKNRVNPWSVAYEELSNLAFTRHTYKHTTMGFEEDIKNMPNQYQYSISFFKRYYRPENCILILAGDFEPENAKALIRQYYSEWQPGYVAPKIQPEPPQTKERKKVVYYEGRTLPLIWQAYRSEAFDPASRRVAAGYILWEFAFGENSELYKQLVLREQKVQFISGGYGFNRDPKFHSVYAMVNSPDDIDYVLTQIENAAAEFKTELVSAADLDKVRKRIRYEFLMGLDTPQNIASELARPIALTGNIEDVDTFYNTLATVTPQDLQDAARFYLDKQRRTTIIVKEKNNAAE
jgi:zinc protease